MPIVKNWVTCKDCNRILYTKDADKDGRCEDCAKPAPKAKEEPRKEGRRD